MPPTPTTSVVATPTPTVTEPSDWTVSLSVAAGNEGSNQNLSFGAKQNATNGFDVGLDVPHPPLAPNSTFDAYFPSASDLFPQLDKDYQAPLVDTNDIRVWELIVTSISSDITLSWNISEIPPELVILIQTDTSVVDVRTQSSMVIPAGDNIVTMSAFRD